MEIVLDDQYYLLIMNLKLEQIDVTINIYLCMVFFTMKF